MKYFLYILTILIISCDYSTDIDTPREIEYKDIVKSKIVEFSSVEFVSTKNISEYGYDAQLGSFTMDTSGSVPVLWSETSLFSVKQIYETEEILHEVSIAFDSLYLKNDTMHVIYNDDEGVNANLKVVMGSPLDPFIIEPDGFNRLALFVEEFIPGDRIVLYIKFKIYPMGREASREGLLKLYY